ncbi:MAG: thioredoxin family protein [Candidatus Melainabacteria bacterium]|nr:thioredoxin family protein [Candidatus Melainabacteria bacterium]
MQSFLLVALLISLIASCTLGDCPASAQNKTSTPKHYLPWQSDLKGSKNAARLKHKLIVVDVYTDNCSWCNRLERETLQNPGVVAELAHRFIWLKLNARLSSADLKPYRISGYPTILVIDERGKLVTSFSGYLPPEQFVEKMAMLLP